MLQNGGIAQMCLCETKCQGGCIAPFWGSANLPEKVSCDMGYRSDSIAVSRDMGPLSLREIPLGGAPACADCPGFLVLGSAPAPAPASTLVSDPQIVPLG